MGGDFVTFCLQLGGGGVTVVPYSEGFKARMVKRLATPDGPSANALSREVGVPQSTLSAWLRSARTLPDMGKDPTGKPAEDPPRSPRSWTADEKLRVVFEASKLSDADLGAFLRREGLHEAQLREWRETIAAGLTGGRRTAGGKRSALGRRIKELERELRRKEKELTEAKVLLALKKKLKMLLGGEDESTNTRSGS